MKLLKSRVVGVIPPHAAMNKQPIMAVCGTVFKWEAEYVARCLRHCDLREIEAASPMNPNTVVMDSVVRSGARCSVLRVPARVMEWEPIALFGVAPWPGMPQTGIPWLLATPQFDRYGIRLLRGAKDMLGVMSQDMTHLENYVHAENARSIRFLEWLGFTVEAAAPWGHKRELFRKFWKETPAALEGPSDV